MKAFRKNIVQPAAVALCAAAALVVFGLSATTARAPDEQPFPAVVTSDQPSAQEFFADAPDGVDPMVTGPVSASFKAQQEAASCRNAVWPNIPLACYPAR